MIVPSQKRAIDAGRDNAERRRTTGDDTGRNIGKPPEDGRNIQGE
jgi:hypothetical protein